MSAKQGPVLAIKPVIMARAGAGKPMNKPRLRNITVIAKPGNQPEYMAQSPTSTGATTEETAHQITHVISFVTDISAQIPETTAIADAPITKRTVCRAIALRMDSLLTVGTYSPEAFFLSGDFFLKIVRSACTREMNPAPIINPWGMYVLPRSRGREEKPISTSIGAIFG